MKYVKSMVMAVMLILAGLTTAYAQEAAQCQTMEMFVTDASEKTQTPVENFVVLSGSPLEEFAANMDRLSGGGHSAMSGVVFLDPKKNQNDLTAIVVFRDSCYVGVAIVPTKMVHEAYYGLGA